MQFSEITGLVEVKASLIRAVENNHVAHAQLFHGREGCANLAMALAFATYLNCENKSNLDACGQCSTCLKMNKLAHPDVSYIFPTAGGKSVLSENFMAEWRLFVKENVYGSISDWLAAINIKQGNIPAEEARQLLQKMSLKSYEGGYKIVIIWHPELLHNATANALLKILEEPPEKTLFLLVCNSLDKLLGTIQSRTQRVAIRTFTDEEIIDYISKNQEITSERAKEIAFLSEGSLSKALEIIHKNDENEHLWFAEWMRACYIFNALKLVPLADVFDTMTKEKQKGVLSYGISIFREIFLLSNGLDSLLRLDGEALIFVKNFTAALTSRHIALNNLENIVEILNDAHHHLERNARAKIVFLDISLNIGQKMR